MANGHGGLRQPCGGRPKGGGVRHPPKVQQEDIRAYARDKYGRAAIDFLGTTFQNENAPYSARVVAAERVLERGYGRPHQAEAPPDPKQIEGIVIEPFHKTNGHASTSSGGPVNLKDWRNEP
jgi:hypothetical protein